MPLVPLKNPESQEKGERKTKVEVKGRQKRMDGGGWYNTTSNYSNFKNKAKIYTLKDDQCV